MTYWGTYVSRRKYPALNRPSQPMSRTVRPLAARRPGFLAPSCALGFTVPSNSSGARGTAPSRPPTVDPLAILASTAPTWRPEPSCPNFPHSLPIGTCRGPLPWSRSSFGAPGSFGRSSQGSARPFAAAARLPRPDRDRAPKGARGEGVPQAGLEPAISRSSVWRSPN